MRASVAVRSPTERSCALPQVNAIMTVMAEFMFVDWLACLAGTCWIVACLRPYWQGELKLENNRIKLAVHLILIGMLFHLCIHMPMEFWADPRLGGQCEWYPLSLSVWASVAGWFERLADFIILLIVYENHFNMVRDATRCLLFGCIYSSHGS